MIACFYQVNLTRSKSLPSIKAIKSTFKEFKRHDTLPANILKRNDLSLLYTPNRSTIVRFKQISNRNKNLAFMSNFSPRNTNQESSQLLTSKEISNLQTANHSNEKVTFNLKANESDLKLTNLMMQEIDKLNKTIENLIKENDNLKREKQIVIEMKTNE